MKKIIIILSILIVFILVGVLYGINQQTNEVETVTADHIYMDQFPDPIPDFVLY
jgi:hypothetical protein